MASDWRTKSTQRPPQRHKAWAARGCTITACSGYSIHTREDFLGQHMADHSYLIARASDAFVFEAFEKIKAMHQRGSASYRFIGVERNLHTTDGNDAALIKDIVFRNQNLIARAQANFPGLDIEYIRGTEHAVSQPSVSVFDQVKIRFTNRNQSELADKDAIGIVEATKTEFDLLKPSSDTAAGEIEFQAVHRSILERLETAATKQIEQVNEFLRQKHEEFENHRKTLDAEFDEKRKVAEAANDADRARLKSLEEELDARKKQLDDRDHTHARRDWQVRLREMLESRAKSFSLSKDTSRKRTATHCVFLFLIAFFAGVFAVNVYNGNLSFASSDGTGLITLKLLKTTGPLIVVLTSALLYIKWMSAWSDKHAATEFHMRQFELDIARAAWAVETAFESQLQAQAKEKVSELLFEGITRDLFRTSDTKDHDASAADQLASAIFGSTSKLKLKIGDQEFDLDRAAIKRLNKTELG